MWDYSRQNCRAISRLGGRGCSHPAKTSRIEAMKSVLPSPRGYFAIGIEGISKPINLGNLLRSAHASGRASSSPSAPTPAPWRCGRTPQRPRAICRFTIGQALPSSPCPEAAAWLASRFSTRPPTLRAFRGPYRLPRCLDPNGERSRPSLPPGASISCAFHRHFPSMLRPPEPLSCMTACALSGASARAPWGPEPRPSPRASRAGRSKARAPGLAAPSRQRKIEAVCFGPAQESGTGRCAGPFELLASSGR
jgi:hypothetical protein